MNPSTDYQNQPPAAVPNPVPAEQPVLSLGSEAYAADRHQRIQTALANVAVARHGHPDLTEAAAEHLGK